METTRELANGLIELVTENSNLSNSRLRKTVLDAKALLDTNEAEAFGLLATIAPLFGFCVELGQSDFKGFVGPESVQYIADEIRHRLRLEEAGGYQVYLRYMSDREYNYVLAEHDEFMRFLSNVS